MFDDTTFVLLGLVGALIAIVVYQMSRPLIQCPNCQNALPKIRSPKRLKELFWGGWTCKVCNSQIDVDFRGRIKE